MPCYRIPAKPPTKAEFDQWKQLGYLGAWETYCHAKTRELGGLITICGDLGPHCADCAAVGANLCDYPVGNDQTCDRPICPEHSNEIGPNLHYCQTHYQMWLEFKAAGGVNAQLHNVIAYKAEK